MIAYHGSQEIKDKYIGRVRAHREADELVRGTGWENGKGCAVGCTLERYDHKLYETELGIPEVIAHLEDAIFEGLPIGKAMAWPERFLAAIKPGADLALVSAHFFVWLLADELKLRGKNYAEQVILLYERRIAGDEPSRDEWAAAEAAEAEAPCFERMADKLIQILEATGGSNGNS